MSRYTEGLTGEEKAERYLCSVGMICVERRYRAMDGEIDLVMREGETIVMVEVKSRPRGRRGDGLLAVTPAKQRRIYHAAQVYLMKREWLAFPVRFDIVEITMDGLWHVPNAFMPGAWR